LAGKYRLQYNNLKRGWHICSAKEGRKKIFSRFKNWRQKNPTRHAICPYLCEFVAELVCQQRAEARQQLPVPRVVTQAHLGYVRSVPLFGRVRQGHKVSLLSLPSSSQSIPQLTSDEHLYIVQPNTCLCGLCSRPRICGAKLAKLS